MTNLDCTVVNCAYNNDKCCSRNDISVKGDDAVVIAFHALPLCGL